MTIYDSDHEALRFLESRGYKEVRNGCLVHQDRDHKPTQDEIEAIVYLKTEWDFLGYFVRPKNVTISVT